MAETVLDRCVAGNWSVHYVDRFFFPGQEAVGISGLRSLLRYEVCHAARSRSAQDDEKISGSLTNAKGSDLVLLLGRESPRLRHFL